MGNSTFLEAKKVLYVEDNEMGCDMLPRRLKRKGALITWARDGKQAIEYALKTYPDIILLDMSLPVKDAWTVARELKTNPDMQHIPIIALVASAMDEDKQKALEAGCDDYVCKPIEIPKLLNVMEKLLISVAQ